MAKKEIQTEVDSISLWELDGLKISEVLDKFGKYPSDYVLGENTDYEGVSKLFIYSVRMETDAEEEKRKADEKLRNDRYKEHRRKQYEWLKKEFE